MILEIFLHYKSKISYFIENLDEETSWDKNWG